MEIFVEIKTVYGNDLIYPRCQKSICLAALANKKTLTGKDIDLIKNLGYAITVNQGGARSL